MRFPWTSQYKWGVDLQEFQIRITLYEMHNRECVIRHSDFFEITTLADRNWQLFFEKLRALDQGKAFEMNLCLPETTLIIKPLPEYPYLTNKELRHALSIFQEQTLPWSIKNCLTSIQLEPESEQQRKKENRCQGYLYALERTPCQSFFEAAITFGFEIKQIALRAQLYRKSLPDYRVFINLFLLEFFEKRVRCHLFQKGILTHYRDFSLEKNFLEYETIESLGNSLASYFQYFFPKAEQISTVTIICCVSEESGKIEELISTLSLEIVHKHPSIDFLTRLPFQLTSCLSYHLYKKESGSTQR
jgi:hypothetical protein